MRIATYNVEWLQGLFDDDGALRRDEEWSARHNVTRRAQADALGVVFSAMDADAVMVIEAPDSSSKRSTVTALENFARHYDLRTSEAVTGFANDTKQEIALLFDPDMLAAHHAPEPGNDGGPRFDGVFSIDLDVDAAKDEVRFSKPPLDLTAKTRDGKF